MEFDQSDLTDRTNLTDQKKFKVFSKEKKNDADLWGVSIF